MSLSVDGLDQYVQDWHPDPVSDTELLSARPAAALAATLDLDCELDVGDALPAMWHSVYFAEWSPTSALGADGHPGEGRFMPPIPNRRRMFAGGRLVVHEPLVLGREATRRAEVVSTAVKNGKTGQLLFVTVRYEYSQDGRPRLTEEEPTTRPALLFRFVPSPRTPTASTMTPSTPERSKDSRRWWYTGRCWCSTWRSWRVSTARGHCSGSDTA